MRGVTPNRQGKRDKEPKKDPAKTDEQNRPWTGARDAEREGFSGPADATKWTRTAPAHETMRRGEDRTDAENAAAAEGYMEREGVSGAELGGVGGNVSNQGDQRLHDKVRSALVNDTRVDARGITVNVVNGIVTLEGLVPVPFMRTAAEEVAARVDGVEGVENKLSLM